VPTNPPTVTTVLVLVPRPPGDWHETLESLNQEVVPHTALGKVAVVVVVEWSSAPKLSPKIVNEAPPLVGAFVGACDDSTGAAAATVTRIARAVQPHRTRYRYR
jgi:hypothetical protein